MTTNEERRLNLFTILAAESAVTSLLGAIESNDDLDEDLSLQCMPVSEQVRLSMVDQLAKSNMTAMLVRAWVDAHCTIEISDSWISSWVEDFHLRGV